MSHVTVFGFPSGIGGANIECLHTCLLWRRAGVEVTYVPTWNLDLRNPWLDRLLESGCRVMQCDPDNLQNVPGLPGGIVSGWCNHFVLDVWPELQSLGCKLIWSPCMTRLLPQERATFRKAPPAAVHFQSAYQQEQIGPFFAEHGCGVSRLIRGAFELSDFPFQPKPHNGHEFYIGRLARPDRIKWSRSMFAVVESVRARAISAELLCMGWTRETENKCGSAPQWAKCFPPGAMPPKQFLGSCHALLCLNGGDAENWPRVGLEAMASGVPVIAERQWGWPEMIEDGVTGVLCDSPVDFINALTRLANDEPFRLSLIENARKAVEKLTDANRIAAQWIELFRFLENEK